MKRYFAALNVLAAGLAAQTFTPSNSAALAARQWRQQHERAIVDEFVTLLAIPDIASDHANIQRNAETIAAMLEKRGISAKLVSVPEGNPVVFGEIKTPGATRTIVFYAHYDGQPLDPKEWATPPFTPTLRDKQLERDAGDSVAAARPAVRSGMASVRPRRSRRQGSDHCNAGSGGCDPRGRIEDQIEHQVRF
jgi:hypothetical protein